MTSQLGDFIIDHFTDGRNENGVEIEFIFLSLEEASNWDTSINNLSMNNGFEVTAIDATQNRTQNIRAGFSFFRGVEMTGPPGSLSFAQRRRIVVIDNTRPGNPVIRHNDLPLSSGALGTENINTIRAALNSAIAPPAGITFEAWQDTFAFPADQTSELADPDRDGSSNLLEFHAGTNPVDPRSKPLSGIIPTPDGWAFQYQEATDRLGITHRLQSGPLQSLTEFIPNPDQISIVPINEMINQITVQLSPSPQFFIQQNVAPTP